MEISQGNATYSHNKNVIVFTKLEDRMAEQVLSRGLIPVVVGRMWAKAVGW
jgi:hypothetical protein